MFETARALPPLNDLALLGRAETAVVRHRALAQAVADDTEAQGYIDQFLSIWPNVRGLLDDLRLTPSWIQQARAEVTRYRETAIEQGQPDVAGEAEALFADLQTHEEQAGEVASTIDQWRETWEQIASAYGSVADTISGWWYGARRAVGLSVLLPAVSLIAAVTALVGVVGAFYAVYAWRQTTSERLQAVREKVLPASALTSPWVDISSGMLPVLLIGGLAVVILFGGRR